MPECSLKCYVLVLAFDSYLFHLIIEKDACFILLNGPQRTQGGLLRLGQALDPCDIESLVGAVASQCAQMLATLQIPERDGPVLPATGQSASIGTHLERLHRPLMRFSLPHALPAVDLPPAQPAVAASTDKPLPTRSPGHGRDYPRMPHKGPITCPPGRVALPALHLPHEKLPALAAAATRGQPRTIGAPGHAYDDSIMPRQPQ